MRLGDSRCEQLLLQVRTTSKDERASVLVGWFWGGGGEGGPPRSTLSLRRKAGEVLLRLGVTCTVGAGKRQQEKGGSLRAARNGSNSSPSVCRWFAKNLLEEQGWDGQDFEK